MGTFNRCKIYPPSVITKLPDCQSFGRKTKLRLNPDRIPNLHWSLSTTLNTMPTLTTQQSQKKQVIISLKVRFIKTYRLRLKLSPFQ